MCKLKKWFKKYQFFQILFLNIQTTGIAHWPAQQINKSEHTLAIILIAHTDFITTSPSRISGLSPKESDWW